MKKIKTFGHINRIVALMVFLAMTACLSACGKKETEPASIEGEAIAGDEQNNIETESDTDADVTDEEVENPDETYLLKYYDEDVIYQVPFCV